MRDNIRIIAMLLFVLLLISGCISQQPESQPPVSETPAPSNEPISLDVEPAIDYYSLEGYTGKADEGFYVISGDVNEVKKTLNEIVVHGTPPKTTFVSNDNLNLVVFRGIFKTGGHGIKIDQVEKAGKTFVVHATYTEPGKGMMATQAFTQPTAIIPIGTLPEGSYEAMLNVTEVVKGEERTRVSEEIKDTMFVSFRINKPASLENMSGDSVIKSKISEMLIGYNITYYSIAGKPMVFKVTENDIQSMEKVSLNGKIVWKVRVGEGLSWDIYFDEEGNRIIKEEQLFMT